MRSPRKGCDRKVPGTETQTILNLGNKEYSAKETKKEDHTNLEFSQGHDEINWQSPIWSPPM